MKLFRTILILCVLGFLMLIQPKVFAYQTVVMDFPGNWYKINYINNERDAIVQFVRQGATAKNWNESVVFHTFKWSKGRNMTPMSLMYSLLNDVKRKNSTLKVRYIKLTPEDTLSSWCVKATAQMPAHCELLRTTESFEGPLSIHYINKNPDNYSAILDNWIMRINKAVVYQSYFRLDRIMNKSMTFEL